MFFRLFYVLFGLGPNISIELRFLFYYLLGAFWAWSQYINRGGGFQKPKRHGPNICIECFSTDWDLTSAGGGPRAEGVGGGKIPPYVQQG